MRPTMYYATGVWDKRASIQQDEEVLISQYICQFSLSNSNIEVEYDLEPGRETEGGLSSNSCASGVVYLQDREMRFLRHGPNINYCTFPGAIRFRKGRKPFDQLGTVRSSWWLGKVRMYFYGALETKSCSLLTSIKLSRYW